MPPRSETGRVSRTNTGGISKSRPILILPAETSARSTADRADPATTRPRNPPPPQQNPINFHFVNLTDPEIDTKTRKSINVHVQRVDRQKKRWERIKRPLENRERFPTVLRPAPCRCNGPSAQSSNAAKQPAKRKQRLQICPTCGRQLPDDGATNQLEKRPKSVLSRAIERRRGRAHDMGVLLGQGRTDPFKTYPVEASPDTDKLVDFFAQFIIPNHLAFGEKENSPYLTSVVPTSLSDPAPFHGMLLSAAFYLFQATGDMKWAQMGIFHLGAGIRAINESLADPSKAVTNANITGVMYLVAFELANGDQAACKFHMDGLAQMVKLRGGIENSHFGFLKSQILWADRTAATLLGVKPYFSPLIISSKSSPSDDVYLATPQSLDFTENSLNIGFRFLVDKGGARSELVKAISILCEKVDILSSTNDSKVWMKHVGPFSEKNIEFEYLLLQAPEEPITAMSDFDAICECLRVAALLFFTAVNEERPSESAMVQSLGAQLKGRLELINLTICLEEYGEELLWIVFGAYRVRNVLRNWFAELLPAIYARLGIETWEECLAILKKFLWLDRIAQPSRDLWKLSKGLT